MADKPADDQANQVILAFDYGIKHIGVAVGQSLTRTANPLCILRAKDGIPQWDEIAALLSEWRPDYLLVGLPLNMDGSESDMSTRARKFANRLHGRFGHRVEVFDERLSSYAAKSSEQSQERGDDTVDALAASIILQSWLQQP